VTNGLDTLTETHRASQAAEQLLATLAQIRPTGGGASSQTMLREEQMLSRISRQFHLPEEKLRSRLTSLRREARGRQRTPSIADAPAIDDANEGSVAIPARVADLPAWDRELLELVILDPTFITRLAAAIQPASISSPVARRVFVGCCRLAEQGMHEDFGRLMAAFDEPEIKNLLVELDESAATKTAADRERWLADLLETHRRRDDESTRRADLAAARQSDASAEQLLAQFCDQSKSKHRIDYERRKK
jgi:hypothetical protein